MYHVNQLTKYHHAVPTVLNQMNGNPTAQMNGAIAREIGASATNMRSHAVSIPATAMIMQVDK